MGIRRPEKKVSGQIDQRGDRRLLRLERAPLRFGCSRPEDRGQKRGKNLCLKRNQILCYQWTHRGHGDSLCSNQSRGPSRSKNERFHRRKRNRWFFRWTPSGKVGSSGRASLGALFAGGGGPGRSIIGNR